MPNIAPMGGALPKIPPMGAAETKPISSLRSNSPTVSNDKIDPALFGSLRSKSPAVSNAKIDPRPVGSMRSKSPPISNDKIGMISKSPPVSNDKLELGRKKSRYTEADIEREVDMYLGRKHPVTISWHTCIPIYIFNKSLSHKMN